MKCVKCGVHYDDADRECPMCGAKKPLFSQPAPRAAIIKPAAAAKPAAEREGERSAPPYRTTTCAHTDPGSCGHAGERPRRASKKALRLIVLLVLALSVIPSLIFSLLEAGEPAIDFPVRVERHFGHSAPEPEPYEEEIFPYTEPFQLQSGTFTLHADDTYTVRAPGFSESGRFLWYECDDSDYWEPELFPPKEYMCYAVSLYTDGLQYADQGSRESYLNDQPHFVSIYVSRETGALTLRDDFQSIFWLDSPSFPGPPLSA